MVTFGPKSKNPFLPPNITLEHFLERCPSGPLFVRVDGPPTSDILHLIRTHNSRITEFYCRGEPGDTASAIAFDGVAVRYCQLDSSDVTNFRGAREQPTPMSLFNGYTSTLRTLALIDTFVLPRTTGFSALTHLMIQLRQYIFNGSGCKFTSLSSLLAFLADCPILESLYLNCFGTRSVVSPSATGPPVRLLRLKTLLIDEPLQNPLQRYRHRVHVPEFCAALFPRLALSRRCTVRVRSVLPHELAKCADSIAQCVAAPGAAAFACMRIVLGPPSPRAVMYSDGVPQGDTFSLQLARPTSGDAPPNPHSTAVPEGAVCFDVQVPSSHYPDFTGIYHSSDADSDSDALRRGYAELATALASSPLFAAVRELHIPASATPLFSGHGDNEVAALAMLRSLPRLETLLIAVPAPSCEILDALAPPEPSHPNTAQGVPCPALHTLIVYVEAEHQLEHLKWLAEKRAHAGHPIRRLYVKFVVPVREQQHAHIDAVKEIDGVDEVAVLSFAEQLPREFIWKDKVPRECWDRACSHRYWPVWH